ncbi:hypothetical protein J437_LFUL016247 [Ladona fulva]|uniref:Uncharacterized protein n=1 Tax=Ladona fulva TaxID=123851 RepID=A0A8K0KPK0_LADFU|nr:hypothetical protein J437_LFUL016247 [Ladona fulva]
MSPIDSQVHKLSRASALVWQAKKHLKGSSIVITESLTKTWVKLLKEAKELHGDPGYPHEPWLHTPILNAEEGSPEARYQRHHTKAHSAVEHSIGSGTVCRDGTQILPSTTHMVYTHAGSHTSPARMATTGRYARSVSPNAAGARVTPQAQYPRRQGVSSPVF